LGVGRRIEKNNKNRTLPNTGNVSGTKYNKNYI
jgi:hypothetical protein